MDTKLKKSNNIKKKAIVTAIVLLFTVFVTMVGSILTKETEYYDDEAQEIVSELEGLILDYKNDDYLASEEFLSKDEGFNEMKESLYSNFKMEYYNSEENSEVQEVSQEELRRLFEEQYSEKILELKEEYLKEVKNTANKTVDSLMARQDIAFYATNGSDVFTNTTSVNPEDFKKLPVYIIMDKYNVEAKDTKNSRDMKDLFIFSQEKISDDYVESENKIYLGLRDEFANLRAVEKMNTKANIFKLTGLNKESVEIATIIIGVLILIAFLALIRLVYKSEKTEEKLEASIFDKLYTDVNVIVCFITAGIWIIMGSNFFESFNVGSTDVTIYVLMTVALSYIGLSLIVSLTKHTSNRTIFTHSIIYVIGKKLVDIIREIYDGSSLSKKIGMLVIGYSAILLITIWIFPVTIILGVLFAVRKVRQYEVLKEGVVKIKEGQLDYKIQLEHGTEFEELANDINEIGNGLKNAVENELKSERRKSELIANVSHDIRTPLTSIITYVDLLKTEENRDKQREYIDVLDKKSERLKLLIEDLFDAAKFTSGDIPVEIEEINLKSLVNQGIVEMQEDIYKNKLQFITSYPERDTIILADGDLLWRSISNLFSNIFKYGLKGSRVYIEIIEEIDTAKLVIKNISSYELNITEEELMERFKRGDESRSSDGSGLGLSITKSLVELQKGKFHIDIDGDLFKTVIEFPIQKDKKNKNL